MKEEDVTPEEVEREHLRLKELLVGPEWASLIIIAGETTIPIFGIQRTPSTEALMERCEVEHYMETGWALVKQDDEPKAWMEIEFISPVHCHITLRFEATDGVLSILASNGGTFALAFDEKYKVGEAIMIEDMSTDVPRILSKWAALKCATNSGL